eukprot:Skav202066  [mRNA]  locus=scaffold1138:632968:635433:- [translate_table: standard]
MDGSTLLLALIYETANQPGKTRLSAGRSISRWGLAVSRSFGDLLLKEPRNYGCTKAHSCASREINQPSRWQVLPGQLVSAEPELRLVELDPSLDRFVVLACDGIWDVLQDLAAGKPWCCAPGV